jgi:predicted esterase
VVEPTLDREYLLYKPSSYDRRRHWPLIVACPGAFPDSPNRQIRLWTQLAEEKGFIVLVPKSGGGRPTGGDDSPLRRLQADQQAIIAAVQHVRGGHSISEDRVFIAGWSQGAAQATFVGLSHPEVFRAIALYHPKSEPGHFGDLGRAIDAHQPVCVVSDVGDAVTGGRAAKLTQWLHENGAAVTARGDTMSADAQTRNLLSFFEEVIRNEPWLRIRAFAEDRNAPLEYRFKLQSTVEPIRYLWTFGDGDDSPVAAPLHRYAKPGQYRVTVRVELPGGGNHLRAVDLIVPQGILTPPARGSVE